ncbi:exodeoxyribonuclease V alpha subunit [Frankineae bacterium MT45]|nr:exodeoxyribonuclease V alpha subunit [Frankineae bacterium MT45]
MSEETVFTAFCAAGLWPGLGKTLAAALETVDIRGPEDVSASNLALLPKVGPTRAGRLFSSFLAAAPEYEVVELLQPAQVDARVAARVVDALGPAAPRLLREDPWRLLHVGGLTPADADRVARIAIPGVSRDDPRRARALVAHVLAEEARNGHTVTDREHAVEALREWSVGDATQAIAAAVRAEVVVLFDDTNLALPGYAAAEQSIAEDIQRLRQKASPIKFNKKHPAIAELDKTQRAAVGYALSDGVSVLTGGPGTGKSRTVAAIVALAESAGKSVALAAPTGRAAKRLEELCESPASTLHRLLGAQPRQRGDEVNFASGFARNREWRLDEEIVVVDETSMLDVDLAHALLDACADGTHLVFVGDAAQLPSIGPGRVLGDLIDAQVVPVTELTTLYRQADGGTIAKLATSVRGGELVAVEDPTHEVVIVAARGSADAAHRVVQLVTDSIPRALGIPTAQVQVVTPVHRGPAGTQGLNEVLKQRLNPGTGRRRFDPGDRVVATANHLEAEPNGYANGEVGLVSDVSADGVVTVDFASGPAKIKGKALADLLHGWAITVHRAQGSEFPAVVVVLPPEAGRMLSRPLVYTALTRAQRHLSVVHGVGGALASAVRRVGAIPRRTRLQQELVARVGAADR